MKIRCVAALLLSLPATLLAAQPAMEDLASCETTIEKQAVALSEGLGAQDGDVAKRDEVMFVIKPDIDIFKTAPNFPTRFEDQKNDSGFCKAICNPRVVAGCGVLLGCVDWFLSAANIADATLCETAWFVVSEQLKDACGC